MVQQLSAVGKTWLPHCWAHHNHRNLQKDPHDISPTVATCYNKKLRNPRTKQKRNLHDTTTAILVCSARVLLNRPGTLEPQLKACNPAELETRLSGMLVGEDTAAALHVQKGGPKMQWFILVSPSRHAFWGGIFHY